MEEKELMTVKDAANLIGVHPLTVSRWIRSGRIKGVYTGAQKKIARYVTRRAIEQFLNEGV